jgi:hypothetical protein
MTLTAELLKQKSNEQNFPAMAQQTCLDIQGSLSPCPLGKQETEKMDEMAV